MKTGKTRRDQPTSEKQNKEKQVQTKRNRNRQAQSLFRQRKQVAEAAQRHRIQTLEGIVQESSNVLIDFVDELLGKKDILRHYPELGASIHHSVARLLTVAKNLHAADDAATPPAAMPTQGRLCALVEPPIDMQAAQLSSTIGLFPYADFVSHEQGRRFQLDDTMTPSTHGAAQVSRCLQPSWQLEFPTTDQDKADTDSLDDEFPRHVQRQPLGSFCLHLIKETVSQACLALKGQRQVPDRDVERVFQVALRSYTREQIMTRLQAILGPEGHRLYLAAGISCTDDDDAGDYLTAVDVQSRLEALGARMINVDHVEISVPNGTPEISGDRGSVFGDAEELTFPDLGPNDAASCGYNHTPILMHLDVWRLTASLVNVAVCAQSRPMYPRTELAKAVQASVVMVNERGTRGTEQGLL